MIRIGSAVSTHPETAKAVREALGAALKPLGSNPVHLAFVFFTPHHSSHAKALVGEITSIVNWKAPAPNAPTVYEKRDPALPAKEPPPEGEVTPEPPEQPIILGCSAQGVVGGDRELEEGPAISVWTAHLPGAELFPFYLSIEYTADGPSLVGLPVFVPSFNSALMLSDPNSFPTQVLLEGWNEEHPGVPIVGGQASGGGAGQNLLIVNDIVVRSGAVGVLVGGKVKVNALVSQGCRPFGKPLTVTAAEGNTIQELAGEPTLLRLREAAGELSLEEQQKILHNLQIGLVIDERKTDLGPGDFLIRGLTHADMETGAISIGDAVHVGQTVQFQLRDAETADLELKDMLGTRLPLLPKEPAGALLFTCNGRGSNMFEKPDHDAKIFQQALPGIPAAGMFCAGEIGPVGGQNFLHGFTASIALFEDVDP